MKLAGELRLKPGKERSLLRRHPWIYDTAIARVKGNPGIGETVAVQAADGRWLAWAAYAPGSTLRARCWSFNEADVIDASWFGAQLQNAVARRAHLYAQSNALRLVFGEADGLPGLVVDQYADQLVLQLQASGVDAWRSEIIDALIAVTGCGNVYERSDSATRQREGLAAAAGLLRGKEPAARTQVVEHGITYGVDVRQGHKTGFYVDQRDNRALTRQLVQRMVMAGQTPRVLNCFCYTGGFSLALAAGGAESVLSIDSSTDALQLAAENAQLNGQLAAQHEWRNADVFEALRALRGQQFDLIVLDPPKFASSHHHVDRAARAYKDITLNALRLLAPQGYLLTFSCSGAINVELFQKIVAGAVIDARVDCQMLSRLAAGEDHPLAMTHPEGEYLKGLLLRRC